MAEEGQEAETKDRQRRRTDRGGTKERQARGNGQTEVDPISPVNQRTCLWPETVEHLTMMQTRRACTSAARILSISLTQDTKSRRGASMQRRRMPRV